MRLHLLFSTALLCAISTHALATSLESVSTQLAQLEASTGGRIGIAAINTATQQRIEYHAEESFPMGCTSKVIGVAAMLKRSMTNNQLLSEKIHYKKDDLLEWAPITKKYVADGMSNATLCSAAISYSDNTAMNLLAKQLGGPAGLTAFARSIHDKQFNLVHGWPDEAFAVPGTGKDATTPAAMTESLRKLTLGTVLAAPQRAMLITWLKNNTTGNARIRAGVPKNWVVGDKTGTGFHYGITADTAVIWPPKCAPIVMTVYYFNKDKNAPKRDDVLASATKIVLPAFAKSDSCIKL